MRRSVALAALTLAAAASVATSPARQDPLFFGSAYDAGPAFLASEERPSWQLVVDVEIALPADADGHARQHWLAVDLDVADPPEDMDLEIWLDDCEGGEPLVEPGDAHYLELDMPFSACEAGEPCQVRYCVGVESYGASPVPVEWGAEAVIQTLESAESGVGVEIPVELTLAALDLTVEE